GDLFAILDSVPLPALVDETPLEFISDQLALLQFAVAQAAAGGDSARTGAVYFPWVRLPGDLSYSPPSGHVAGVYAFTDASNGVQKAPANQGLEGPVDGP